MKKYLVTTPYADDENIDTPDYLILEIDEHLMHTIQTVMQEIRNLKKKDINISECEVVYSKIKAFNQQNTNEETFTDPAGHFLLDPDMFTFTGELSEQLEEQKNIVTAGLKINDQTFCLKAFKKYSSVPLQSAEIYFEDLKNIFLISN